MFFLIVLMFDEFKHQMMINTINTSSNFSGVKVINSYCRSRIPFTITIFLPCANMLMDTPPSWSALHSRAIPKGKTKMIFDLNLHGTFQRLSKKMRTWMHAGLDVEKRSKMWSSSPKVKPQLPLTENFLTASILRPPASSLHFYLNWKLHFRQANVKNKHQQMCFWRCGSLPFRVSAGS